MSRLMPQADTRQCGGCRFSWTTAFPHATDCPNCGEKQPDVSNLLWRHVCSSGHGADHGGDCAECMKPKAERASR